MRSIKTFVISVLLTGAGSVWAADELWMLRFDDPRPHRHMHAGCYGTASYAWRGPRLSVLEKARTQVFQYAKENVVLPAGSSYLAWSMTKDPLKPAHRFVLDLETGEVKSVAEVFASEKALIFCRCHYLNLPDCDKSGNLGALDNRESFHVTTR